MRERPILFSAPMVRALLAGRKTVTRRLVKWPRWADDDATRELLVPPPHEVWLSTVGEGGADARLPPYAEVGDRLWVKETWRLGASRTQVAWNITYTADGQTLVSDIGRVPETWRMPKAAKRGNVSPLFMPRWASRLTLEVTDVRIERLWAITEEDAVAEGVERREPGSFLVLGSEDEPPLYDTAREAFEHLWCDINGPGSWAANPWVWRVAFRVVTP